MHATAGDVTPADALRPAPGRLVGLVVLWHLGLWVALPWLAYRMLPLDALELLGWGQEWQWGYYKHPPLGPWLGEAFVRLYGGRIEALYLLAQLALVATLLYVWKTARLFLDPARAALATVLLEGSYFHTFLVPNFNMNSLQLPLWAGFAFHLLRALQGRTFHWYACGIFAALCLYSKYSGGLLLATGAVLALIDAQGRRALRGPHPWGAAALALLLLLPHLLWLRDYFDLPWQYLRSFDAEAAPTLASHLFEPTRFAAGALLSLLLAVPIFLAVRAPGGILPLPAESRRVLVLCLGPLLLAMLYGAISGSRLKSTWAFPFFSLVGVAAFLLVPTRVDPPRWRRATIALAGVMLLIAASHLVYKLGSDRSKTAFDGPALARAADGAWRARYDVPLRVVVGDHVYSAIVSSYAPSRPSMLIRGDYAISPWLTPAAVAEAGAIAVCRLDEACFPEVMGETAPHERIVISGETLQLRFLAPRPGR
jgi:4-amino-4-deoxy-L-arabinose transferase-like glycosyltransferase